jgi:ribonucleoside-diphosphate reductase alpha chain
MKERPELIKGSTRLMKTGCGNLYVTINQDANGKLIELFTSIGKAGGCASSQAEAIGRLVSIAFQSDIDPQKIIKQLKGIQCHIPYEHNGTNVLSCSDAIAQSIERYLQILPKEEEPEEEGKEIIG